MSSAGPPPADAHAPAAAAAPRVIDLNADVGEGFGRWSLGDDEALLKVVTSANVACGFFAGDPSVMRETCQRAAGLGVAIGAQVGYRDLAGFGRRFVDVPAPQLRDDVLYQIGALQAFAAAAGTEVSYVKPHGALYNAIVSHEGQAEAVVRAVADFRPGLPVLGLPGSAWLRLAEQAELAPVPEAFADRAYAADGTLVPRSESGAVLDHPGRIAARCVQLATRRQVLAIDGSTVDVDARSICVHGDTPGAVDVAQTVRMALQAAGFRLASFTSASAGRAPSPGAIADTGTPR